MIKDKTYRATVDPKFLQKVDRIFDASPRTIFNELLQNARRAKATEVTVTIDEVDGQPIITFEDNGEGVVSPSPLLHLAGSEWDKETDATEDPAGMGFFSLSTFDLIKVHSRDWYGEFTPAVFCGSVDLATSTMPYMSGMKIQWSWPGGDIGDIQVNLKLAAEYCGLKIVRINFCSAYTKIVPKGFLDDMVCKERFPEYGFSIGVEVIPITATHYGSAPGVKINFNGVRINESLGELQNMNALSAFRLVIRVDVWRVQGLQLVLPARNALKHTETRKELLRLCEGKAYEWVAQEKYGEHNLAFEKYARARDEFGIDIGEAKFGLRPWSYENCHWHSYYTPPRDHKDNIVVESDMQSRPLFVMWTYALNASSCKSYRAHQPDARYAGYKWYDELPRLTKVITTVDDKVFDDAGMFYQHHEEWLDGLDDLPDRHPGLSGGGILCWVNELKVEFQIAGEDPIYYDPDFMVTAQDEDISWVEGIEPSETKMFIKTSTKSDVKSVHNAAGFMCNCVYTPSEDGDAEHYELQAENFERQMTSWLFNFYGSNEDSVRYLIEQWIKKFPWEAQGEHFHWTLECGGEGRYPRITSLKPANTSIKTQ